MIITKIELENITTHKKTTIDFQRGLNLLYGPNGSGKSTVLKMIGFVLFDSLPGNQKNYVRESSTKSPKFGKIKLWVEGLNDDQFIIQRTLAKAKQAIEVSDARTGIIERGINNATQLQEWLKIQLSLSPEVDLANLFRTSVGVQQGTFTEPFLRTPQKRKDFFNPVLQMDVYRTVWSKIRNIIKEFDKDLQQAENKQTELETRLETKDDYEKKKEQNEIKQKNAQNELHKTILEIAELNELFKKQKRMRDDLIRIQNTLENLESRRLDLHETSKKLSENLNSALSAEIICKESLVDYERYRELIKEEIKFRKLYEKLTGLQEEIFELNQQLTKINTLRENIQKQIENILKDKANLSTLEKESQEFHNLKQPVQVQRDKISKIDAAEDQLNKLKKQNLETFEKVKDLENILKELPEVEEKSLNFEALIEKSNEVKLRINSLETEINTLLTDKLISKDGVCPILKKECDKADGKSFDVIFQEKIENLKKNLTPIKSEFEELNKKTINYNEFQKKLSELKLKERDFHNLRARQFEFGKEIKKLITQINLRTDQNEILNRLKVQQDALEPSVEKYNVLKEKVEKQLPELQEKLGELQKKFIPLRKKLIPLEKEKKKLIHVPDELKEINDELDKLRENHDKFQKNEIIAKNMQNIKLDLEKCKAKLSGVETSLKKQTAENRILIRQFNEEEFKKIDNKLRNLEEAKGNLKNQVLDAKNNLAEAKEKLKALKETEEELTLVLNNIDALKFMKNFTKIIRNYFDGAGPKITEILLANINIEATSHYRNIMDNPNVILEWEHDYQIKIKSSENEKEFHQLSGGEQMAAALAIRLAILKVLSNAEFAFFDEPTMNLDSNKRENLGKIIQRIKGFKQFFVISHDDTFEENVENVIKFSKDEKEITRVDFISKTKDLELV